MNEDVLEEVIKHHPKNWCHTCRMVIETGDLEHRGHNLAWKWTFDQEEPPPTLGIHVSENISVEDKTA